MVYFSCGAVFTLLAGRLADVMRRVTLVPRHHDYPNVEAHDSYSNFILMVFRFTHAMMRVWGMTPPQAS